jgi:L-lactate dehydrogenase complex protein LldG
MSGATTRAEFLARVREAARAHGSGAGGGEPDPPGVDERLARLVEPGTDTRGLFVERATRAGIQIVEALDPIAGVTGALIARRVKSVVLSFADAAMRSQVASACRSAGVTVLEGPRSAFDADAGITDAEMLVAETGSILIASGTGRSRLAAFAPGLHIVLAGRTPIAADLIDAARAGGFGADAAAQVLVSGPSKTADIEGVLVTGVHGPGEVVIVLESTRSG